MPSWQLSVGDSVELAADAPDNGCLGRGEVGNVCTVADESDDDEPYEVISEAGKKWWYEADQLVKASGKPKKGNAKLSKKKPPKAAAVEPEEIEVKEDADVLAGISDDDESEGEAAKDEAGDDDFDAGDDEDPDADEDNDDDEEFTTDKPKVTRKRRREMPQENSGSVEGVSEGRRGRSSRSRTGNAFAPMDDQPVADPRVDPYCEINDRQIEGKVVELAEDGSPERELYSVTLRKAPTGLAAVARTAVIQVIQFSRGGVPRFCAFARWGAAGAEGQKKATEHSYLDGAISKFEDHYYTLTGNRWSARHNGFLKKDGKYEVVDIDVAANVADLSMTSDDKYEAAHPVVDGVSLKLGEEVASFVRDLSDFGKMYRQLEERGVELGRLPVCRFTKKHVRQGFTALKSLQFILNDTPGLEALSEEETAEIVTATYQFYAACPHVEEPDKITSTDQVAFLSETLVIMAEIEKAAETIRFERTVQPDVHPLDRDFALLKSKIDLLEVDSSERHLIEGMVADTSMPNLDGYKLKVKDVFSLERQGEGVKYGPFAKLHNKQLLWHGSPRFSNRTVLREGLRVQPPFAPSLGKTNGICFYDLANAAAQVCGPAPGQTAILVLAEVALGDVEQKRVLIDDTVEAPAKFYHSLQSIGAIVPDADKSMDVGGVKWHLGPLAEEHIKLDDPGSLGGQQPYNMFVVHDESQFCMRYIVAVEFSGMKPSVAAQSAVHPQKPADYQPAARAAHVTFADSVETSTMNLATGGSSQLPTDELEEFSMTQDGPECSQADASAELQQPQEHSQTNSKQGHASDSGSASQTGSSGLLPTFTPSQAAEHIEETLQTFTASGVEDADEASATATESATDEYTLDMIESQASEDQEIPVAMDAESSDGED